MAEKIDDIDELEIQFLSTSDVAFATARKHILASGLSILESEDGAIYEVFPDGRRRFEKSIEPPISVVIGSKSIIKCASSDPVARTRLRVDKLTPRPHAPRT